MASGLIALLDDVATIAKLASASVDQVAGAAGKAGAKAAGVVIDDAAIAPRYVVGLPANRELRIIGNIARGSMRNKLLFLLPAALLLTAFAPFLTKVLLMIGGSYLAFEASEKILETILHEDERTAQLVNAIHDPAELEARQVAGAIRTDFILSAEIMAIALATLEHLNLLTTAIVLTIVAVALTVGIYSVVALIVKLDDIGLHMMRRGGAGTRAFGKAIVRVVPTVLAALSIIGTAAMLWVAGGILLHGLDELGLAPLVPQLVDRLAHELGEGKGFASGALIWLVKAIAGALTALVIGSVIALTVRILGERLAPN
jgi:predicted DNA repair protein MutK